MSARSLVALSALVLGLSACSSALIEAGPAGAEAAPATTVTARVVPTRPVASSSTSTSTSSSTTTSTRPSRGRLVIHGTGDVSLDPDYIPSLVEHGYEFAWSGVGDLFASDSLTVVNLECPVSTNGSPLQKEFTFRCDPAAMPVMAAAGVEVANLANNHSRDYGVEAMLDSLEHLRAAGVQPVGVGVDARAAHQPAILEVDGWRIAVLGFGGVVPSHDWLARPDHPGMADGDDLDSMAAAVAAAAGVADLVVVSVHWGVELGTEPDPGDVERARAMVAAGADIIFGHHSHRLNPLTLVDGKPVAWGLGNFVWPRLSEAGARTAVAQVVVEPDGSMSACLLPAEIVESGHPRLTSAPPVCPDDGT